MDIYQEITSRIIDQLDKGIIPWHKPWISSGRAVSHITGKPYSLLNQMLLSRPGEYVTFSQCQQEGGKVRKGEKASMIVFWKWLEEDDPETGEKKQIPFLRYYNVFHIDQCEGLRAKHIFSPCTPVAADENAESIISSYLERSSVNLRHMESDQAYYQSSTDTVTLPLRSQFRSTPSITARPSMRWCTAPDTKRALTVSKRLHSSVRKPTVKKS